MCHAIGRQAADSPCDASRRWCLPHRKKYMCGIIAYVGRKLAQPLLIEGLKRLEYRGYDWAGIAVIDQTGKLHVRRAVGRISVLEASINDGQALPPATLGMAHTRWA